MSAQSSSKSQGGSTLGGLIVLLINVIGFGGIGYAVGGVTGAIWVTIVGLILFGLLFAWPSLTSGAEQTGLAKVLGAPIALIASIVLFIPAVLTGILRKAIAKRDERMGVEPAADAAPAEDAPKPSLFRGRWTDATTLSMFLINAVVGLLICLIIFGPIALTVFALIATPVFLVSLFFIGLNGANPELAAPGEDDEIVEA
ncbi:MAG: hypothetical protein KI785_12605 [Devosiaceae bacterium]|nr:hypothetical protein [Devosiaceae bacterium MH13]